MGMLQIKAMQCKTHTRRSVTSHIIRNKYQTQVQIFSTIVSGQIRKVSHEGKRVRQNVQRERESERDFDKRGGIFDTKDTLI